MKGIGSDGAKIEQRAGDAHGLDPWLPDETRADIMLAAPNQ